MADRYVAIHESKARTRKLPGYEEPADWHEDNGWALFECDDAGAPVRLVFCDQMEPEDAILVRDLRPLVAELNRLASRAPSPPETPASEGTMGDRDRLRDGIEAAARVLAANGIDARSHLDLRPDARREITEILASASPASSSTDPATKEQS